MEVVRIFLLFIHVLKSIVENVFNYVNAIFLEKTISYRMKIEIWGCIHGWEISVKNVIRIWHVSFFIT